MEENTQSITPEQDKKEYHGCLAYFIPLWLFTGAAITIFNIVLLCTSFNNIEATIALSLLVISNVIGFVGLYYLYKFKALGFYLCVGSSVLDLIIAGAWPQYMLNDNAQMRSLFGLILLIIFLSLKKNGKTGFSQLGLFKSIEDDLLPRNQETVEKPESVEPLPAEESSVVEEKQESAEPLVESVILEEKQETPISESIVEEKTVAKVMEQPIDVPKVVAVPAEQAPIIQTPIIKQEEPEENPEEKPVAGDTVVKEEPIVSKEETVEPEKKKKKILFKISSLDIALLIYSILLCVCLMKMPYGYYTLIRYIGMVIFLCVAFESLKARNKTLTVIGVSVAFLLQPFYKLDLGREMWNYVDVILACAIVVSVIYRIIKTKK